MPGHLPVSAADKDALIPCRKRSGVGNLKLKLELLILE
jgi:hypothetical protein